VDEGRFEGSLAILSEVEEQRVKAKENTTKNKGGCGEKRRKRRKKILQKTGTLRFVEGWSFFF
jgi:hypothetical protein